MARKFSLKGAKILIGEHQRLLAGLRALAEVPDRTSGEIAMLAEHLRKGKELAEQIGLAVSGSSQEDRSGGFQENRNGGAVRDGMGGSTQDVRTVSAQDAWSRAGNAWLRSAQNARNRTGSRKNTEPIEIELITSIYRFRHLASASAGSRQLLDAHEKKIERALTDLAPAGGGLKWLFAGSEVKRRAEKAFDVLMELLTDGGSGSPHTSRTNGNSRPGSAAGLPYGTRAEELLEEHSAVLAVPPETIRAEFTQQKAAYRELLARLVPGLSERSVYVPEIDRVLTDAAQLLRRQGDASGAAEQKKETVLKAVDRMQMRDVLKILTDVPVEEVNRSTAVPGGAGNRASGGIRVKTLRDNAVCNMADIYRMTPQALTDINGISEDTAYLLKRIAQNAASETKKTIRIRLNADEKTEEAAGVLAALYDYKRSREEAAELSEILGQVRPPVQEDGRRLTEAAKGLSWIFGEADVRQRAVSAWKNLDMFCRSATAQRIESLYRSVSGERTEAEKQGVWGDFEKHSADYFSTLEKIAPGVLGDDDTVYGLPEELALAIREENVAEDALRCTLRRYQEWGVKYILHQKRVLLGDEMGLGKTIQAIAAMVTLKMAGATHFLVICPASVITNWSREVTKHSTLSVIKIHGRGRNADFRRWKSEGGVGVTTYETTAFLKMEEHETIDLVVVDEAHYIKNPYARRTENTKRLCAHSNRLLFMTGTALENRVGEMISLIRILQPDVADQAVLKSYLSTAPQFRGVIAPVYYRRKREDVLNELPDLIETQEWLEPGPKEVFQYEKTVLLRNFQAMRRVSWNVEDPADSCKAQRMKEIVEEAASEGRKVLVFSFFLDTLRTVKTIFGDRCRGPVTGAVPPAKRQEILDSFDDAPPGTVLAAQIQTGGTGLNIQSASVVILCEPQLKPSVEMQAIARAYRMGQSRNVLVYRLLCETTVDEHIMEILEQKQNIFNAFADDSAAAEIDMLKEAMVEESEIRDIIDKETARIEAKQGNGNPQLSGVPENAILTSGSLHGVPELPGPVMEDETDERN